jgi:outer membrane lipoprotein-sorting protein
MTRQWMRWLPAIVAPVIIGAGAVGVNVVATSAAAGVDLPTRTPEQVIALIGHDSVSAFSGTVEQSSELGLPALPSGAPSDDGMASALELLTGTHTARVFVDGADRARVQVTDDFAERDVVRNGSDVWTYDSAKKAAMHVVLPAGSEPHVRADGTDAALTPAQLAHAALDRLTPSTAVSLGENTSVAGRPPYDHLLTPKSPDTLVGDVSVAVDAATGMPLRVSIAAKGHDDSAVTVAFTKVTLQRPEAGLFAFTPPAGTAVTQKTGAATIPPGARHPDVVVTGSEWTSVVELPAGSVPADLLDSPLYSQTTTSYAGGRLLSTALLNILVTADGRVLAGSVTPELLQAAAAG